MYGPVPSAPAPAIAGSSLSEEIVTLHIATNNQILELDSRLADTSAYLSDLDDRITEFNGCIQDLTNQRSPLQDERDSLRNNYKAHTSESALFIVSTAYCIRALADTVPDSTSSHTLTMVATARTSGSHLPKLGLPPTCRSPNPNLS